MRKQIDRAARKTFLHVLSRLQDCFLELSCPDRSYKYGDLSTGLRASLVVHDERFFRRVLTGGDLAAGEAYMAGDWTSPDLVALIRLAVRNLPLLEGSHRWLSAPWRALDRWRHRRRANTPDGSRKNIRAHYDLSNAFFRLFLDSNLVYSCAYFETAEDSLEIAQLQKMDRICRKLQLRPTDHILEIGTGWGAFAVYAARTYGCRVTTTTISRQQYDSAAEWFARAGLAGGRVRLLLEDYRSLRGRYDKIASIEMFEAVGLRYYDDFFSSCDRLLQPDGVMLLQTIAIHDQKFPAYHRQTDWIQKYIFPGSELASVSRILQSLARASKLSLYHAEDIGTHYARTLAEWRRRFHSSLSQVRTLGFDERFIRMWDYYLAWCEGAFLERHIGDFQLLLARNHNRRVLYGEPWAEEARAGNSTDSPVHRAHSL